MTIVDITNILTRYIEGQPIKPMVTVGSVYENFNTKELKYPIVNFDNVNTIKKENDTVYSFTVYYADRLNEDGSNLLDIQSQATTALQLLLKNIYNSGIMTLDEFYNAIISPFRMKFTDKCAGAWMQVNIHTIGINDCGDFIPSILTITENGKYDVSTYEGVEVNVPTGETPTGTIEIIENGTYDVEDYKNAHVMVDPDGNWQSGYTSGYTDGYQVGRNEGFNEGYQSGRTDGFSDGYQSGHTDGYSEGYSSGKTEGEEIGYQSGYTNGFNEGYQSGHTDGYSEGYQVGFNEGYQSGFTDGVDSVPLTSITINQNGTYTSETGGWNEVVVDIPTGITPSGTITITSNGTYNVTNKAYAEVNVPTGSTYNLPEFGVYTPPILNANNELIYDIPFGFYLENVPSGYELSFKVSRNGSSSDRFIIDFGDGTQIEPTTGVVTPTITHTYTSTFSGWVLLKNPYGRQLHWSYGHTPWGNIFDYCKAMFNDNSSVGTHSGGWFGLGTGGYGEHIPTSNTCKYFTAYANTSSFIACIAMFITSLCYAQDATVKNIYFMNSVIK